jgi:hypothetical protein
MIHKEFSPEGKKSEQWILRAGDGKVFEGGVEGDVAISRGRHLIYFARQRPCSFCHDEDLPGEMRRGENQPQTLRT